MICENWMIGKINYAFRNTISTAIINGDGVGKPLVDSLPPVGHPGLRDRACTSGLVHMAGSD